MASYLCFQLWWSCDRVAKWFDSMFVDGIDKCDVRSDKQSGSLGLFLKNSNIHGSRSRSRIWILGKKRTLKLCR